MSKNKKVNVFKSSFQTVNFLDPYLPFFANLWCFDDWDLNVFGRSTWSLEVAGYAAQGSMHLHLRTFQVDGIDSKKVVKNTCGCFFSLWFLLRDSIIWVSWFSKWCFRVSIWVSWVSWVSLWFVQGLDIKRPSARFVSMKSITKVTRFSSKKFVRFFVGGVFSRIPLWIEKKIHFYLGLRYKHSPEVWRRILGRKILRNNEGQRKSFFE